MQEESLGARAYIAVSRDKKRPDKLYEIFAGVLGIAMLGFGILNVIHPRLYYFVDLFVLVIMFLYMLFICLRRKMLTPEERTAYKDYLKTHSEERKIIRKKIFWKKGVSCAIIFIIVYFSTWFVGPFLETFTPNHSRFEYAGEMARLQISHSELRVFPKKIPAKARGVHWYKRAGLLQLTPAYRLSFYADDDYLDELVAAFQDQVTVYPYGAKQYETHTLNRPTVEGMERYPGYYDEMKAHAIASEKGIPTDTYDDLMVYEYMHHPQSWEACSGFYISREKHYVCFYFEVVN